MNLLAFLLALVALVMFLIAAIPKKDYIAWGLSFLTVAWVVQIVWATGTLVQVK